MRNIFNLSQVRMRSVDAPVLKASLWVSEVNYEVYPPTEGRCRRQSLEWPHAKKRTNRSFTFFISVFSVLVIYCVFLTTRIIRG